MAEEDFRILQISSADMAGGAEKVAFDLFRSYRQRGRESFLAVGVKLSADSNVFPIPNEELRTPWARLWRRRSEQTTNKASAWDRLRPKIAEPWRTAQQLLGREDFEFPGFRQLLKQINPTVIHGHNLHGDYFDLRILPWLTNRFPLFLTLHDAWLLSGHCAHSFDCDGWKAGCGRCPDLTIYPAIRRDATRFNWQRKKDIFNATRCYVATPCRWLMKKVNQSMLLPAITEGRVIPYGIDISIFQPRPKSNARAELSLPANAQVLLFAANGIRNSIWKDYSTLRAAVAETAMHSKEKLIFIALGEDGRSENVGDAEVRFIPHQTDPSRVAQFYQAADIYIHAARADTFPNVILEALACGTPVVATAIGGIPEQIEHNQTGFLVPPGDGTAMARAILNLLANDSLRERMGQTAAVTARARFNLDREVDEYLKWYEEVCECRNRSNNGRIS